MGDPHARIAKRRNEHYDQHEELRIGADGEMTIATVSTAREVVTTEQVVLPESLLDDSASCPCFSDESNSQSRQSVVSVASRSDEEGGLRSTTVAGQRLLFESSSSGSGSGGNAHLHGYCSDDDFVVSSGGDSSSDDEYDEWDDGIAWIGSGNYKPISLGQRVPCLKCGIPILQGKASGATGALASRFHEGFSRPCCRASSDVRAWLPYPPQLRAALEEVPPDKFRRLNDTLALGVSDTIIEDKHDRPGARRMRAVHTTRGAVSVMIQGRRYFAVPTVDGNYRISCFVRGGSYEEDAKRLPPVQVCNRVRDALARESNIFRTVRRLICETDAVEGRFMLREKNDNDEVALVFVEDVDGSAPPERCVVLPLRSRTTDGSVTWRQVSEYSPALEPLLYPLLLVDEGGCYFGRILQGWGEVLSVHADRHCSDAI